MLNEAVEYLNASIITLLAYKRLVCGKYLAWGKGTLYYGQFYALNCLLRLRRYALIHLDFLNEDTSLMVRIINPRGSPNYRIEKCTTGGHKNTWLMFAQKYPEFISGNKETAKSVATYSIGEREDWTYDLFYTSQTTDTFALQESDKRCNNNFLDPDYDRKHSGSEGESEYYGDLMANFGWEEAAAGEFQKYAIDSIEAIGKYSKYPDWYIEHLSQISNSVQLVESSEEMRAEMGKWLANAISQIQQSKRAPP